MISRYAAKHFATYFRASKYFQHRILCGSEQPIEALKLQNFRSGMKWRRWHSLNRVFFFSFLRTSGFGQFVWKPWIDLSKTPTKSSADWFSSFYSSDSHVWIIYLILQSIQKMRNCSKNSSTHNQYIIKCEMHDRSSINFRAIISVKQRLGTTSFSFSGFWGTYMVKCSVRWIENIVLCPVS